MKFIKMSKRIMVKRIKIKLKISINLKKNFFHHSKNVYNNENPTRKFVRNIKKNEK